MNHKFIKFLRKMSKNGTQWQKMPVIHGHKQDNILFQMVALQGKIYWMP